MIDVTHPANQGVLGHLGDPARLARSVAIAKDRAECLPADVKDPYLTLGTHPDLVTRLWDELGGAQMYALRLDAEGFAAARSATWVFGRWHVEEPAWLRAGLSAAV
jgi:hypothetical protein